VLVVWVYNKLITMRTFPLRAAVKLNMKWIDKNTLGHGKNTFGHGSHWTTSHGSMPLESNCNIPRLSSDYFLLISLLMNVK